LNYLFVASQNVPQYAAYVAPNSTNYKTNSGIAFTPPPGATALANNLDNATIEAVNAATGQMVWSYYIPTQGYRGGLATSGNVVYITLSSGDLLMINAQTGTLIKDLFIGGPLNVLPSIGATASGQMLLIVPITAGAVTWGTGVPGDLVALSLQNVPSTNTVTATATTTATSTATTTVGGGGSTVTMTVASTISAQTSTITATTGGIDPTAVYGVAAVAAIFIVATGFLALRGRRPAP
jgi:hypothetical protein